MIELTQINGLKISVDPASIRRVTEEPPMFSLPNHKRIDNCTLLVEGDAEQVNINLPYSVVMWMIAEHKIQEIEAKE